MLSWIFKNCSAGGSRTILNYRNSEPSQQEAIRCPFELHPVRLFQMTDFVLGALFENVFSPKGAQNNSQKWGVWGVWGGLRGGGMGFRVYGIKKSPAIYSIILRHFG